MLNIQTHACEQETKSSEKPILAKQPVGLIKCLPCKQCARPELNNAQQENKSRTNNNKNNKTTTTRTTTRTTINNNSNTNNAHAYGAGTQVHPATA
jgi:hypothetical protein